MMSDRAPYLGLMIPALLAVIPFNMVAFSWGVRHGNEPMPAEITLKSRRMDKFAPWLKNALFLLILLTLSIYYSIPFSQMGLRSNGWPSNLAIGFLASLLQLALQGFVWKLIVARPARPGGKKMINESSQFSWLMSNLLSVSAEELWIAFCVVTLKQTGHTTLASLVLIGVVFGIAHFQYKFGAVATGLYGLIFASLFLWRRSLLPSFIMHYTGNIVPFYWPLRGGNQETETT